MIAERGGIRHSCRFLEVLSFVVGGKMYATASLSDIVMPLFSTCCKLMNMYGGGSLNSLERRTSRSNM